MKTDLLSYPLAPVRPVSESMGGISFVDPYEWLEEDSPETLAWQSAQNERAVRYLHSWAGYDRLRERLAAHTGRVVVAPHRAGSRWFRMTTSNTPEVAHHPVTETGRA